MGWEVGFDEQWQRDIGYGVPATCDYPGCGKEIDRGLSFVCGGEPYGGECGCGLYFCEEHLVYTFSKDVASMPSPQLCERCSEGAEPFTPTPDLPIWINHKATHPSWEQWRRDQAANRAQLTRIGMAKP